MKYYKIDFKSIFEEENKVLGHANGEFVPNGAFYFDRIGNGEIIEDAPVFDYFHLQSFDKKKFGNGDCKMCMDLQVNFPCFVFGTYQIN